MKKLILSATLILAACADGNVATDSAENMAPSSPEISITNAVITPPLAGRDVAAGYFKITSSGGSDRLLSAHTPDAASVELHTHLNEDGVMKMREVDAIALPDGETVSFERGGYHLMLFGADFAEGQESVAVTLDFEVAGDIVLMMPIDGVKPATEDEKAAYGSGHEGH